MGEHLIAREIVEVVAGDRDLAGALADRAAAAAPMLAATLKRHFDAAEDGHRRRIERLVLALDPCDPVDFEASLVANLDAALYRALPQQLARAAAIDPAEDALDLIVAFLESGFLPWWTRGRATALAEATETLILAADSQNPSVILALRHLLGGTDAARRLVRAVPVRLLSRLAACLAGVRADDLDKLAIVLTAEQRDADLSDGVMPVWSSIMVAAAQKAPFSNPEAFGDEVRAHLALAKGSGEAKPPPRSTPPPASDPLEPPEAFGDEVRAHLALAKGSGEAKPPPRSTPPPAPDPLEPPEAFGEEVRAHSARAERSGKAQPPQTSTPPPAAGPLEPPEAFGDEVRARLARAEAKPPQMSTPPPASDPLEPPEAFDGVGAHPARAERSGEAKPPQASTPPAAPDPLKPPAANEPPQPIYRPAEGGKDETCRETAGTPKDARPVDDNGAYPPDTEIPPAGEQLADLTSPEAVPAPVTADFATTNPSDTRPRGEIGTNEDRESRVALPSPDVRPTAAEPANHVEQPFVRDPAGHRSVSSRPIDDAEQRAEAKPAIEHDSIYIEAAGIVMLGPFLADYFAAAGLIASGSGFVTPGAQHRAVALIDYLATADRNPPEWRLVLAKLLTGLPIDTILATGPLDDVEAATADALLAAVLAELPMLGQLTVDGFRSAWLNRPGLLTVEHGEWLLRIERRGWDVLLERLPWSIGWLQLPWQPEGIRVEW